MQVESSWNDEVLSPDRCAMHDFIMCSQINDKDSEKETRSPLKRVADNPKAAGTTGLDITQKYRDACMS